MSGIFTSSRMAAKSSFEQMAQSLHAGPRQDQFLSQPFQRSFQGDEILRRVVHQQDLDPILRGFAPLKRSICVILARSSLRYLHTRRHLS